MFDGFGPRSLVSVWNELGLEAIRAGAPVPTEITRAMHMAHSAMYDAWAAHEDDAAGAYFDGEATGPDTLEDREIAVSFAAFRTLSEVFPDYVAEFEAFFVSLGLDPSDVSTDPSTPEGIGNLAAMAVISARENDGANAANDFADTTGYVPQNSDDITEPGFDPNAWTPLRVPNGTVTDANGIPIVTDDPSSYTVQVPISPHWGTVDPFAIGPVEDYLPPAPPQLGDFTEYTDFTGKVSTGDQAYRDQFGVLVDISAGLTPEQKVIAEVWADGPQSSTPPGHWNEIAQEIAVREGYDLGEEVKFFFALNNALFDTSIATWGTKYIHDYVRPQTAIRHLFDGEEIESWAGPNQGTQTINGEDWNPYQSVTFVTPAFPEFTSGHSGFSYAAATIIEAFTGTPTLYDGVSTGVFDVDEDGETDLIGEFNTDELVFEDYDGPTISLRWDTVWEAAAEAGLSRLYGGIHIKDGDLYGRQLGTEVAQDVWAASTALFTGNAEPVSGTVGEWLFENEAKPGEDTSPNANTALLKNGAAIAGGALQLDGGNDYALIDDDAIYDLDTATLTITFTVDDLDGTDSGTNVLDRSLQALFSRDAKGFGEGGHIGAWVDGDGSVLIRHQTATESFVIDTDPGVVMAGVETTLVYTVDPNQGGQLFVEDASGLTLLGSIEAGVTLNGNNEPWTLGVSRVSSNSGAENKLRHHLEGSIAAFVIEGETSESPSNEAPVAVDDSYSVGTGETLSVAADGVLANDTDPNGDAVQSYLFLEAENGDVALNPDGSFDYTPDADFVGSDSFTYLISDGDGGTDIGQVWIDVLPEPDVSVVGDWDFEDPASPGADASVFDNPAQFRNGAAVEDGAVLLDGKNDFVLIEDNAAYDLDEATIVITFTVDDLDGSDAGTNLRDGSLQALFSRDARGFADGGHVTALVDGDGSVLLRHQTGDESFLLDTAAGVVEAGEAITLVYQVSALGGQLFEAEGEALTLLASIDAPLSLAGNDELWTLGASQYSSDSGAANNLRSYFEGSIESFQVFDDSVF